jgi:hypothetical protein
VGADGDPRVPTINVKNIDGGPLGPHGGFGSRPGSERCVVNCIGMKEKSNSTHGPILSALSSVMADDPLLVYGAWVIQCDTI